MNRWCFIYEIENIHNLSCFPYTLRTYHIINTKTRYSDFTVISTKQSFQRKIATIKFVYTTVAGAAHKSIYNFEN